MRRHLVGAIALAATLVTACTGDAGVRSTNFERVPDTVPVDDGVGEDFVGRDLPIDPATTLLTLDNGLVVYLRENNRPGGSAELRLAVDAGSAMEGDDQAGVAHFLEHMLFNGTEQFPGNQLVDTLRSFGMEFGADVNAYTSYDETVYELTVPVDDSKSLGVGLDVLAEWLSAATIDPAEVEAERGVVLDEWRVRDQTVHGRQGALLQDMFLANSAYAGRQPIGNADAIREMTAEPLRRFYDDWYRPDNAAIVVVGDIDVSGVERMVRDRFEGLSAAGDAPEIDLTMSPFSAAAVDVAPDPDETEPWAELTWPRPATLIEDTASMRADVMDQLAFDMIATRLGDDASRGTAPFREAQTSDNNVTRAIAAPSVYVRAAPEDMNAAIDALVVEFERARRYGFDDNELARAVDSHRSAAEADYDERDTRQDVALADDFVEHFLGGAPIPSADDQHAAIVEVLDSITTADVEAAYDAHLSSSAPHLFVAVPDDADAPDEGDLLTLLGDINTREIEPREDSAAVGDSLMEAPGAVEEDSSEDFVTESGLFLDATRLQFANGATVILNPTPISDGYIYIAGSSPGGSSQLSPHDAVMADYATDVVQDSGLGELDAVAVHAVLEGSEVELAPFIDLHEEGFFGDTSPGDLELAMQLLHQMIAAPQFSEAALAGRKAKAQQYLDDPAGDPDLASYAALQEARYGADPRFAVLPTQEALDALTVADVERIYRDRFSNASDWVFVLSGDFDLTTATDLARRYVGTLEGDLTTEERADVVPVEPAGVVTRSVLAGTGDQGSLTLRFEAPSSGDPFESVDADVLTSILGTRLIDHVREALGASYSPHASVVVDDRAATVQATVFVSGDPSGLDQLALVVLGDMFDLASKGPSSAEFESAIAALEQEYSYSNDAQIAWALVDMNRDSAFIDGYVGRYDALLEVTPQSLTAFASTLITPDQYILVTQKPR